MKIRLEQPKPEPLDIVVMMTRDEYEAENIL